jgi:hypothetical protein
MEICMLTLLLSAFLYLNALSLVFFLCIGAGMALPEGARRRTWAMVRVGGPDSAHLRCTFLAAMHMYRASETCSPLPQSDVCGMQVVLPLLGGLLLYQYSVLIGLPPGLHWGSLRHLFKAQQLGAVASGVARAHHHSRPPDAPSTALLLKVRRC